MGCRELGKGAEGMGGQQLLKRRQTAWGTRAGRRTVIWPDLQPNVARKRVRLRQGAFLQVEAIS